MLEQRLKWESQDLDPCWRDAELGRNRLFWNEYGFPAREKVVTCTLEIEACDMMVVWEAQDYGGHGQEGLNAEAAFADLYSHVRGVLCGPESPGKSLVFPDFENLP